MDKHAMRVPPHANNDFFTNPPLDLNDEEDDDDDDRSCDFNFHPYQSLAPLQSSTLQNHGLRGHLDSVKVTHGKSGSLYDGALSSEIEQIMKELSNNLLHGLEGISSRLLQLESRTQKIENTVDDLKYSAGYNFGRTDGKLRQIENILLEVKDGVHFLREKQEIAETQLQLAKVKASNTSSQAEDQNSRQTNSMQQASSASPSAPQQSHPPLPGTFPLANPISPLTASLTLPHQNFPPVATTASAQLPGQLTPSPIPAQLPNSFYSQGQAPEISSQQYHLPPTHYSQTPPPQVYPPSLRLSHVSQSSQPLELHVANAAVTPQNCPSPSYHPEETPYFPSYSYSPSIPQSSSQPAGSLATQEFHMGPTQQMHSQFSWRPKSDEYYGGPPSHYGRSSIETLHLSRIPSVTGVESNYSQLPKAQILPCALPTALNVEDGLEYEGTGNRVPMDDVVEKVTAMGFRRDLVRATARKMAENGQSVDLNMVLDKLMNSGSIVF
ncbi:hypothetical protein LguiB_022747 [Lonicera macranthoides]